MFVLKRWPGRFRVHRLVRASSRLGFSHCVHLLVEVLEDRVVPSTTTNLLGFENGLTGWNVNKGDTGLVSVVTQWTATGNPDPTSASSASPRTYSPEGDNQHFAVLKTAGPDSVTTLSQTFTLVNGGERLSFSAFFDAGDHAPFNDYGDVVLYKGSVPLVTLFAESILGGDGSDTLPPTPLLAPEVSGSRSRNAVGDYGNTPWTNLQYVITNPGTYTLEARTSNADDNALDSYLGLSNAQFVEPAIDVGNAVVAPTGVPIGRTITFTDPVPETFKVEIDPGTGTFAPLAGPLYTSAAVGGINYFQFNNAFSVPGTYDVIFRIHDIDSNGVDTHTDATLLVNVFTPQQFASLDQTGTQMIADANQAAGVAVGGTSTDGTSMHMDAILGGDPGASVFAGSYKNDPTVSSTTNGGTELIKVGSDNSASALPTAFFDLRAAGVDADSTLTTTLTVEIDPAQDINAIKLYYSNGGSWLPVEPDPNFPITKTVTGIDPVTGKEIVKIQFTATKDSKPSIIDLHGTVFTIALPAPPSASTTTQVNGPAAALSSPPTTALTTTFSSDAGGTFVLRVSQATDLSASRTEASSSTATAAAASTTGANSWTDYDDAVRMAREALDINWLLDAMKRTSELNTPNQPAAGGAQQNRPVQPTSPEVDNQGADETVQVEVMDALFAKEMHEESDVSLGTFGLQIPSPAPVAGGWQTRRNPGWALLSTAFGFGRVALPNSDSRRRRYRLQLEAFQGR
jgi:hypothetical protein